jgi:lipopolysaccharide/colanic/teichoic acid biosynthesis glycosyltransferase
VEAHFERSQQAAEFERELLRVAGQPTRMSLYRIVGKRMLDAPAAAIGCVLLSPLFLVVYLLVRWQLGSPVIFRQRRSGWYGRPFTLYKFRTMRDELDAQGRPLADEQRLTRFGQWLRSLSLDELPQLWNILRGDMSVVGPRPLLDRYLNRYSPQQARRLDVRPGITGWAQINGRNAISWNEKFRLDVWYVDHCSLGLDIKILWRTCANVFSRRGIRAEGHATMPEFMGDEPVERSASLEETVQ